MLFESSVTESPVTVGGTEEFTPIPSLSKVMSLSNGSMIDSLPEFSEPPILTTVLGTMSTLEF